jgi:biotin-dependent carboxylase-like uncharacterized protein
MITVIRPGHFTTIQDAGRWGYQTWGLPISGALDPYAYQIANILAGNAPGAAVLEMTDEGGVYHFDNETMGAVAGADMSLTINGEPVENWSTFSIPAGANLVFGKAKLGRRTYFAVCGGIVVQPILDSCSTCVTAGIGGIEGRRLYVGDMLEIGICRNPNQKRYVLPPKWRTVYGHEWQLAVTPGPQANWFSFSARKDFLSEQFIISSHADRSVCEIASPLLDVPKGELVSDATGWGAIEVPAGGQLLLVLPDHGTTRGFMKIAYVIQADYTKLAQLAAGDRVKFHAVTWHSAVDAYKQQQKTILALRKLLKN